MYLQKLELQGFKSFAHKTTLEFNRQLTAVVGPNGSGKSNITDAIRWVLGEQSVKLLRGKRAEDVIFAGSDQKSRLGMAEVSLYLNNEDHSAPIDYSEIVVTRRVFRDGQSEYLLNGSAVRLQDIQLLLAQANFGQRTYSVIGQGMVDSILVSSPSDRKEFFEEATGVKQYQLKREQSITKLTATYENLEQAAALMNEIEPRLRSLTRQVKRLERREELERDLRELQKSYYRYRYNELERRRQTTDEQFQELRQHSQAHAATSLKLTGQLAELERQVVGVGRVAELEAGQRELGQRLSELTKQQAYAEAQAEIAQVKRGQGELVLLQQRASELEAEVKRYDERLKELEADASARQAKLGQKLEEQVRVTQEFERYQGDGAGDWLERELEGLAHEQVELGHKLGGAANLTELKALALVVAAMEERLSVVLRRLKGGARGEGGELAKLLELRDRATSEVASLRAELAALEREQRELVASRERAGRQRTELAARLGKTGEPISSVDVGSNLVQVEAELHKVEDELRQARAARDSQSAAVFDLQRDLAGVSAEQHKLDTEAHAIELELARLTTRLEDLEREMAQEVPSEMVHAIKEAGTVEPVDEGTVALELQKLKHQLELTGGIEPEVVAEYQQTKTRYDFLFSQTTDLTKAAASLEGIIRDLDATIEKKFLVSFRAINEKFGQYFRVLFDGGKAQLVLQKVAAPTEVDDEAEAETDEEADEAAPSVKEKFLVAEKLRSQLFAGVEIQATPPGKKLSSITALSGGEKALASIALICAIISNNPSPFVVLDEVDAALDEANSERYAAILASLMDATQFITVSHNRATMKRAAILYGVTMGEDGVSKLLSVKFDQAKEIASKGERSNKV